jgi:ABC-type Mn2+/Zn2+ transport system ATPase subunit
MYEIFESLLREKGITAYKISKETGVTQTALSNWKRGKSTPNARNLQKLADYLEVSLDYLMTGNTSIETFLTPSVQTVQIAQALSKNPTLYQLLEDAKNADNEDLETILYVLQALKRKESKNS